ncbi:hypothetical protein FOMPIDRAFT_1045278 [Fomitopsis schrenkii]|uniref:Uncharacterized protein n=1 Tax=Fomitopsis schrenkii TaxID=2126942 RepID=S8EM48_FOMSC|nr:hypothetical protein FOMPIDRAFT_1045278 [Fomitopsis schrenkii]
MQNPMYFEIKFESPSDALIAPALRNTAGTLSEMNTMTTEDSLRQTHQNAYIHWVLARLQARRGTFSVLQLVQAWSALPTESTAYWDLLDREPFVAYGQQIVLPSVTSLTFREVHPKFVIAFLRAFHLPSLTALDLDYNIDHSQPDRRALLRMLIGTAWPLLARLTHFQTSYEMHCHDPATIALLYRALPNVTHFRLHYWGDSYECEEWWDVLRAQWEHVAAHPEARPHLAPYLPRLRRLHTCGFSVPRLRGLLELRARLGCPIREIEYGMGLIWQSEHDELQEELDVFVCFEDITPDPVQIPTSPARHTRGLSNTSRGVNAQ